MKFLNDPVGSTSTIITNKFIEAGCEPSPAAAGLLLSGILSDTMVMKLSTTTPADTRAARYLADLTGIDPVAFGTELVGKGMELGSMSPEELLTRDMKRYNLFGKSVMIAQVMVSTFEYPEQNGDLIRQSLERLRSATGTDCFLVLFTNVFANASDLFAAGEDACLTKLALRDQPVRLEGVMSRKKDFLPQFGQMFRNL